MCKCMYNIDIQKHNIYVLVNLSLCTFTSKYKHEVCNTHLHTQTQRKRGREYTHITYTHTNTNTWQTFANVKLCYLCSKHLYKHAYIRYPLPYPIPCIVSLFYIHSLLHSVWQFQILFSWQIQPYK